MVVGGRERMFRDEVDKHTLRKPLLVLLYSILAGRDALLPCCSSWR